MLRVGKAVEVVKEDKPQQVGPMSPEEADAPGVPPPPLIANLEATWQQLAAAQQSGIGMDVCVRSQWMCVYVCVRERDHKGCVYVCVPACVRA